MIPAVIDTFVIVAVFVVVLFLISFRFCYLHFTRTKEWLIAQNHVNHMQKNNPEGE